MSLEVVAAIIFFENKILVTQRKFSKNSAFSYKYEFPGGKVEDNEDKITALRRELMEELNLEITTFKHFASYNYNYDINKIKEEKNILKPLAVKLSPDIDDSEISEIIELILKYKVNGIIISNTTDRNRDNLSDFQKNEKGGLSGKPLKDLSSSLIKKFYKETKGKVQIIGVGGVDSGQSAFDKISSGANVVQLYTGMVYKGPGVVKDIKKELISIIKKEKLKNIDEAVGIST